MKPRTPSRRLYLTGLILLLAGIVAIGAYALSLLIGGQPAFPVDATGDADVIALHEAAVFTDDRFLPRYGSIDIWSLTAEAGGDVWPSDTSGPAQPWVAPPIIAPTAIDSANALSWAGNYAQAARAYALAADRGANAAAYLSSAQNYWYAGDALAADSMLVKYLARVPGDAAASALLIDVRRAAAPGIATAERWARTHDRPLEQLILARALVREARYAEAVPVYRRALSGGAADSVHLELAAAASAADSTHVAIDAFRSYLIAHDDDVDVRIALARALSWRGDYAAALPEYDRVRRINTDNALAFERAQLLMWSGQDSLARVALRDVVARDSTHTLAHQMLGDLARYRAAWPEALLHYQAALRGEPDSPELASLLDDAREGLRIAQQAALPVRPATVVLDAVSDRAGFRWLELSASQTVALYGSQFRLTALQTVPGRLTAGVRSTAAGVGGRIDVSRRIARAVTGDAGVGIRTFGANGEFLTLTGAVQFEDVFGLRSEVRYTREPAVRRTATLLALHARAMASAAQVTVSGNVAGTELWAVAEGERITSMIGGTDRGSLGISLRRPLTTRLALTGSVSAVATSQASPSLAGWGSLAWSPELYVQPAVGLAYRVTTGPWSADVSLAGGYAFARERSADTRFGKGGFPAFAAGAAISYTTSRWELGAGGQYGGAAGDGYRSTALTLRASYLFR